MELPGGSNRGHETEDVCEEKFTNGWLCNDTSGT